MFASFALVSLMLVGQVPTAPATAAPAATPSAGNKVLAIDAARSKLTYDIVHKLHKVHAEAKSVEGKAMMLPDGKVQVMVRVPVSAFNSGDGNRDAHMQETTEATKFPYVTVKAVSRVLMPAAFPATLDVDLDGVVEFHGQKQAMKIPAKIEWLSNGEAHVTSKFDVSLDAFKVERPSLLLMKIDDACAISADLYLKEEAR